MKKLVMLVLAAIFMCQGVALATDFDVVEIPELGAANIQDITGFNNLGQVIGRMNINGYINGFAWGNGILANVGTLHTNNDPGLSESNSINNKGQVVGTAGNNGNISHSFQWEGGVIRDLNVNNDTNRLFSFALGVNDSGTVVGKYMNWEGNIRGMYFLKDGVVTEIGSVMLGLYQMRVNNKGQVLYQILDYDGSTFHTYIWENGVAVEFPGGSGVSGLNDKSQAFGTAYDYAYNPIITIWDSGIVYQYGYGSVYGMNNSAQIVGLAYPAVQNQYHPFFLDTYSNENIDLYEKIRTLVGSDYWTNQMLINEKGQILISVFSQDPYYVRRTFILSPTGLFCQNR
ncbi:MAG: hypothetical protein PHW24_04225 [Candidatus Moranbacteria bacterium]|nr:hypothetical protein [Candidatus Moranbacteria bacterium]